MQQSKPNCLCRSVEIRARYCRKIGSIQVLEKKLLATPVRRIFHFAAGCIHADWRVSFTYRNDIRLSCAFHSIIGGLHTHSNIHSHTHLHSFTHLHAFTLTHTYTHTYTHTHTNTHTNTQTFAHTP